MSGSSASLTLTFPTGAFVSGGAPSTCSMTGTGTGTVSGNNKIAATATLTWGASCVGTIADRATETDNITLNKQ
jgi:hypothetical protein